MYCYISIDFFNPTFPRQISFNKEFSLLKDGFYLPDMTRALLTAGFVALQSSTEAFCDSLDFQYLAS